MLFSHCFLKRLLFSGGIFLKKIWPFTETIYTAACSTRRHVTIIYISQQITDQMEKPLYILLVDLTAAFDHVVRVWLFKSIYQRLLPGADTTLIKMLQTLYESLTTALSETPEDVIELTLGVRQGGPASPPLSVFSISIFVGA